MDFKTLGNRISDAYIFKGAKEKPFLAPRGVCVSNGKLFVSDTGQNRVFIWNRIPENEFADPDIVLGQENFNDSSRNSGGLTSASSLQYPSGIWSDGNKVIVADAWNHRVLIWNNFPQKNAQKADVVIGQEDFIGNQPNILGIGNDPRDNSLNWPYGVFSDGKQLWIADTGNRRVLYFKSIPENSFAKADGVIGKPNFNTRDYENEDPIWPYSVKINEAGQMAIADTQFYRILVWKNWKDSFFKKADIIIGQKNFTDCGQNQYKLIPDEKCLNWTYDACFYKNGILVNDTGNSRILGFNSIPNLNNESADWLVGRPDFHSGSEFSGNLGGTSSSIYWPFSIITFEDKLIIADTGNHRLIFSNLNS